MKFAYIALVALALPAASAASAQQRPVATLSRAAQLDVVADFLVPRFSVFTIGREMCDTTYRTQLVADPELAKLEKGLPGMIDRMVGAASAYCDVEMKKVVDARQAEVRTHLAGAVSPADLARLARLFAPVVQEQRDMKIEVRPGDTLKEILARLPKVSPADEQLRVAQNAFARTPGGVPLLNQIYAYQGTLRPLVERDQKSCIDVASKAFEIAHRAANLHAQEKGILWLYPEPSDGPPATQPASATASAVPRLAGSSLYVYSFLDVREEEYTPKVLDRFDADLTARFSALNVSSKILRFSQSSKGRDAFVASRKADGTDTISIPVGETVGGNFIPERLSGARYRLIVFPDNYTLSGAWRFYDIRFMLIDAATDKTLLEYSYSGSHLVMLKNSENAEARSKKILDRAFAELKAKGFL